MSDPRALVARYLRQRQELGERELFLERLAPGDLPGRAAEQGFGPATANADVPSTAEILELGSLELVQQVALGCPRCRLATTRTQVVFGEGNPRAELLVVGEAPGADEDRTGRPFVGRAGRLLTLLLASVGFAREAVYICNVLKCRPPGNRDPQADEVESCSPYLQRQLDLVHPRVVLACGSFAAQSLLGSALPIGHLRGRVHECRGTPLIATYHPAALLRNPGWIRSTWEDLQRLRGVLHAPATTRS